MNTMVKHLPRHPDRILMIPRRDAAPYCACGRIVARRFNDVPERRLPKAEANALWRNNAVRRVHQDSTFIGAGIQLAVTENA